jgi:DNA (cytosine-5)-methyltransferase 1
MGRIHPKNTTPEMRVRKLLHSLGYRYKLHDNGLPGKPDIVFPGKRKVIFIHGCFWHLHQGCMNVRFPKSRLEFWGPKLEGNAERDRESLKKLQDIGWDFYVIWECETIEEDILRERLVRYMESDRPRSIELFTGAGGLALGVSRAGFRHEALIELDSQACETIRYNQFMDTTPITDWQLYEMDVRNFDYSPYKESIDLLGAGAPCQPFSLGGKHRGSQDDRNMFPEVFRAIRELKPKVIFVENVRGLKRRSFIPYLDYILLQMKHPEIACKRDEPWTGHRDRLERFDKKGGSNGLQYDIQLKVVNAADYGVPQIRDRVIIIGIRSDLTSDWHFPAPTHGIDVLLYRQWATGEYWDRHGIATKNRPEPNRRHLRKIAFLRDNPPDPLLKSWKTVRDAIHDLPEISEGQEDTNVLNHFLNPGAKSYPGHTGSAYDWPAKTLKAGVHGVPGGENTLADGNGGIRYFSVRECARLQTFPDEFYFPCSWSVSMRQLGNAVPVDLSEAIAAELRSVILSG